MKVTPQRSFAKTITWRVCATLTTILLVWIFFGNIALAFSLGAVEVVIKMLVYYLHERTWNNVNWGRI